MQQKGDRRHDYKKKNNDKNNGGQTEDNFRPGGEGPQRHRPRLVIVQKVQPASCNLTIKKGCKLQVKGKK